MHFLPLSAFAIYLQFKFFTRPVCKIFLNFEGIEKIYLKFIVILSSLFHKCTVYSPENSSGMDDKLWWIFWKYRKYFCKEIYLFIQFPQMAKHVAPEWIVKMWLIKDWCVFTENGASRYAALPMSVAFSLVLHMSVCQPLFIAFLQCPCLHWPWLSLSFTACLLICSTVIIAIM